MLQVPLVLLVQFVITGVAPIVMVPALLVAPSVSVAVKVKLCAPVKPLVNVKRAVWPSANNATVPPTAPLTAKVSCVVGVQSSVANVRNSTSTGAPPTLFAPLLCATGASFCAVRFQVFSGVMVGSVVGIASPGASGTNHTASVVFVTPVRLIASLLLSVFGVSATAGLWV